MEIMMEFDPVSYIQEARKHGLTQEQSEFHAQQLERIIKQQLQVMQKNAADNEAHMDKKIADSEIHLEKNLVSKELATRGDIKEIELKIKEVELRLIKEIKELEVKLETKIGQYKYDSLKFIVWTGIGVTITLFGGLGGMIAKGFHWW